MPYKSKAQRAWLHIHRPDQATKWDAKYGGGGKNLPQHVKPKAPTKKK
jgi:hypothetical protein